MPMNPEAEGDVRNLRQAIAEARASLGHAAEKLRAVLGDEAIMPETPVEAEAAMESAVGATDVRLQGAFANSRSRHRLCHASLQPLA